MYHKVNYHDDFDALMFHLRSKYGKELFTLDGIGDQTDIDKFARNYFNTETTTAADVVVDENSNVASRDVITFNNEVYKPYSRFNSYYLMWKELRRLYGAVVAADIIEAQLTGAVYINDFSNVGLPYCFNYSTYDIVLSGLPMIKKIKSTAPKSLYAFKSQVEQFVVIASNSTLGATGLADLLICMSMFVDKTFEEYDGSVYKDNNVVVGVAEEDVYTYVKETIISTIYTLNQPLRGAQSPFTNVSVYGNEFLESLVPEYLAPWNNTAPKISTVKRIQELYIEAMNEELERTPVTFPVTTACFSTDEEGKILDAEFKAYIAKQNLKFGFINIYCGPSSTLSSCCFTGDTLVFIRTDSYSPAQACTLKAAYENYAAVEVFHKSTWYSAKPIRVLRGNKKLFSITLQNGTKFTATEDHLCVVKYQGDVRADALEVGFPIVVDQTYLRHSTSEIVDIQILQDKPKYVYCLEMKDSTYPYFSLANGIITHNCRLRSDTTSEYFNTFGAGSTKIGSLGVVTLNLPRMAYDSDTKEDFKAKVLSFVEIAARINNAKRHIIKKRIELKAMPLYDLGFMDLKKQYSTVGINGLYEALVDLGMDILDQETQDFVVELIGAVNALNDKFTSKYKAPHNTEQVPSENSAVKLVKKDEYMGYKVAVPFYSNQFIPLQTPCDMLHRLNIQGNFDKSFSGGAICHVNIDEEIKDPKLLEDLMDYAASQGVVYWAVNYKLKECCCGKMYVDTRCPSCGDNTPINTFSRVVGFLTNVSDWAKERRENFSKRVFYPATTED